MGLSKYQNLLHRTELYRVCIMYIRVLDTGGMRNGTWCIEVHVRCAAPHCAWCALHYAATHSDGPIYTALFGE